MINSKISCIYYEYRVARGNSYSIEIRKEKSDYFLSAEFNDPKNSYEYVKLTWKGKEYTQIIKSFFDGIVEVIDENNVFSWDGFNGYDPKAKDGWGFILKIDFENDMHLTAEGDNSFPPGYSEVRKEFNYLINELITIYHDKEI